MDPKRKIGTGVYRQNEVMTANKETVLLMLYAGAVRFLKQAIEALNEKRTADKSKYILKTHDIVAELRAGLKRDGGEISVNLDRLYDFVIDRLVQGNMNNAVEPLNEALGVLTTLNDAWEQAVASLKKEKATAAK